MSKTLEKRFQMIRRQVEGLRPRTCFESTYFIPLEEELGCVPVNKWHTRILSELDFCLQMKTYAGTDVQEPMDAALTVLEEACQADGVLTDAVCKRAEACLMPLAKEAQTYHVIMVGHAHLDMNWKWSWDETVVAAVSTFRTMLKLMEEYPDFHFSQSQASIYQIIEEHAPEMMPEIKKRIQEGRWEVLASTWVEMDKNMPCIESLQNQFLYAKKYLDETWGVDPESLDIDFAPDTFGHSTFVPELATLTGIKYYYHVRGYQDTEKALYCWQAPSGKELLVYKEPYWYSSGMIPSGGIGMPRLSKMSGGLRTGLLLYGVGNHGGGPTRRDLNRARWMMQWPVFPVMRFGRLRDYFLEAESAREQLPVVTHELNAVFTGCYTTQSRIKRGNRRAETALLNAEKLSALTALELGGSYADDAFEKAWRDTLFTHFHDILTGSCVQDSREHAMGLYQKVLGIANTKASQALETLADAIDTSALTVEEEEFGRGFGAGVGYGLGKGNIPAHETGNGMTRIFHIVNTTSVDREENTKLTVWDWPGNMALLETTDEHGNVIPCECISGQQIFWSHRFFELLVTVRVPAHGYTTVVLREKAPELETDCFIYSGAHAHQHMPYEDIVLENSYLAARFDGRSGELYSLIDKATGNECIRKGETGGLRYIIAQKDGESSWIINRYISVEKVNKVVRLEPIDGRLQSGLRLIQKVADSEIITTISLGNLDKFLKVQMQVDWKEESKGKVKQPILSYCIPLENVTDRMLCDVPGGAIWRPQQELDVPCQRYAAAELTDGRVLALVSDCKHGFRLSRNDLFVTLINTAEHPDPYPERGIHEISLYLLPSDGQAVALAKETDVCLNPLQYVTNTPHEGSLSTSGTLLNTVGDSVVFRGVSMKDGALAMRMYEAEGKKCPVTITVNYAVREAYLSDVFGNRMDIPVSVTGQKIEFIMKPYMQAEIRIRK